MKLVIGDIPAESGVASNKGSTGVRPIPDTAETAVNVLLQ